MRAIIMAGGEGTRLRAALPDAPKPMAPLLGKPVMRHIVELLARCGFSDICVTLRYMPESIMDYFGDGRDFGVSMSYKIEDAPLGTAGSVRMCEDFYGDRDFLVISGDAACDFELGALTEGHRRHKNAVTMALYEKKEPLSYGLVLTDSLGVIKSFIEKPAWDRVVTNRVNTGIYMLSPAAMELVPRGLPYDFGKNLFPELLRRGERLMGLMMEGYWCDIGTPEAYYQCNLDALSGKLRLAENASDRNEKSESDIKPAGKISDNRISIACHDRARLMRRMAETLMEAGADFSDGIYVPSPHGGARVRAAAAEESVSVDGADKTVRERLASLARELDES